MISIGIGWVILWFTLAVLWKLLNKRLLESIEVAREFLQLKKEVTGATPTKSDPDSSDDDG